MAVFRVWVVFWVLLFSLGLVLGPGAINVVAATVTAGLVFVVDLAQGLV